MALLRSGAIKHHTTQLHTANASEICVLPLHESCQCTQRVTQGHTEGCIDIVITETRYGVQHVYNM